MERLIELIEKSKSLGINSVTLTLDYAEELIYKLIGYDPKKIITDYVENRLTVKKICKKYKIADKTFYDILEKNNVPKRTKRGIYPRIDLPIEEIKEMYLSDYSLREIAKIYFVSENLIYNRLKEIGITKKDKVHRLEEQIKELYQNETLSIEYISDTLGVSEATVINYIKKLGLEKRKTAPKKRELLLDKVIGREKFAKIYNELDKYTEISDRLDISVFSIAKYAKILGLPPKPKVRYIINETNQDEFIELYNNPNNHIYSIALHYNTSDVVIRKAAKRLGLTLRGVNNGRR